MLHLPTWDFALIGWPTAIFLDPLGIEPRLHRGRVLAYHLEEADGILGLMVHTVHGEIARLNREVINLLAAIELVIPFLHTLR